MSRNPLKTFLFDLGSVNPLKDGSIKTGGLDLEIVPNVSGPEGVRRMIRNLDFDVAQIAFAGYLCAKAHGVPMTAIPIFPHRTFHHDILYYNPNSGITRPEDLQGRRVGIRSYVLTPAIWARGMLQTDYGVDLSTITWVRSNDEHIQEYRYPPNVVLGPQDKDMITLLEDREYDAALWFGKLETTHPNIKPLFPDKQQSAVKSYQNSGIYPMNHVIAIKSELVDADPTIATQLYAIFKASRDHYVNQLAQSANMSPESEDLIRNHAMVGGELLPYGIKKNQSTIEAMVQFAVDQQVIPDKVSLEEIFVPNTLDLD